MKHRVSVIMSVYQEEVSWIRHSIDSILNQTYKDYEFIIVNDCPARKDNCKLLNEYAAKDNRILLISNNENIGLTKSLNKAIEIAKGEYIARMDADDYSLPSRFEKQVAYLESHPDVVLVGCYAQIMDEKGRIIGEMHTGYEYEYLKAMIPFSQPVFHPSMMYRRVIDGVPVKYDENMRASQDYELCTRLISYPITNIPEYLLYYRNSGKQMTKVYRNKYLKLEAPIRKDMLFKSYNGISEQDANAFIKMYYGLETTPKEINEIGSFIVNLYKFNSQGNAFIKPVMTYILVIYIKSLKRNVLWFHTLKHFVKVNKCLGNKFYYRVLLYVLGKITCKIKYRLCNVRLR